MMDIDTISRATTSIIPIPDMRTSTTDIDTVSLATTDTPRWGRCIHSAVAADSAVAVWTKEEEEEEEHKQDRNDMLRERERSGTIAIGFDPLKYSCCPKWFPI